MPFHVLVGEGEAKMSGACFAFHIPKQTTRHITPLVPVTCEYGSGKHVTPLFKFTSLEVKPWVCALAVSKQRWYINLQSVGNCMEEPGTVDLHVQVLSDVVQLCQRTSQRSLKQIEQRFISIHGFHFKAHIL
jgi:hypothetical protein